MVRTMKPGTRVSCYIDGDFIEDGVFQYEDGKYYLCQNKVDGSKPHNTFGYKYGWSLGNYEAGESFEDYARDVDVTQIIIKSIPGGVMRRLTPFLEKSLSSKESNFYRLGWIELYDNELVVTSDGRKAIEKCLMLGDGNMSMYAKTEIARIEAEEKEALKK